MFVERNAHLSSAKQLINYITYTVLTVHFMNINARLYKGTRAKVMHEYNRK